MTMFPSCFSCPTPIAGSFVLPPKDSSGARWIPCVPARRHPWPQTPRVPATAAPPWCTACRQPASHAHGRACRLAPSDTLAERIAPRLHGLDRGLHFRGQREDDRCVPTVVGGRIPEYHRCGLLRRLARAGVAPAETPLDRHHERAVEWGCRHPGGVWVHGLPPMSS